MVLCEESVFVSTKHPLQSTEKKPQEKTCKSKSFASLQESDITKDEQNTNKGANKGTVPGIHAPGGGAPANSPSSPPNCRSVTFPSEQRGYLRGAGAHFSGKGTEVILV